MHSKDMELINEVEWLKREVADTLQEGIVMTALVEPADPVDFLGRWLQQRERIKADRLKFATESEKLSQDRVALATEKAALEEETTRRRAAELEERKTKYEEAALERKQRNIEKKRERELGTVTFCGNQ